MTMDRGGTTLRGNLLFKMELSQEPDNSKPPSRSLDFTCHSPRAREAFGGSSRRRGRSSREREDGRRLAQVGVAR